MSAAALGDTDSWFPTCVALVALFNTYFSQDQQNKMIR